MAQITIEVNEDDGDDLFRETQKRLARLGLNVYDAVSLTLEVDGDIDNLESNMLTDEEVEELAEIYEELNTIDDEIEGKQVELATEDSEKDEESEQNPDAHNAGTKQSKRPDKGEIEEVLSSSEYVTKSRIKREDGDNPYLPVLEVLFSSREPLRPDQIFELTNERGKGNLKRMWKNHLLEREENNETRHWWKYSLAPRGKQMVLEIRKEWSGGKFADNMAEVLE